MAKENRIEKLKEVVDIKRADRERIARKEQAYKDRIREIREAPRYKMEEFWCERCEADFVAPAYKSVNDYYELPVAVYRTHCPKGHECIRRITDRVRDPYWRLSFKVRRERVEHEDDLLQPSDPRFRIKYPEQWKKLNNINLETDPNGGQQTL